MAISRYLDAGRPHTLRESGPHENKTPASTTADLTIPIDALDNPTDGPTLSLAQKNFRDLWLNYAALQGPAGEPNLGHSRQWGLGIYKDSPGAQLAILTRATPLQASNWAWEGEVLNAVNSLLNG